MAMQQTGKRPELPTGGNQPPGAKGRTPDPQPKRIYQTYVDPTVDARPTADKLLARLWDARQRVLAARDAVRTAEVAAEETLAEVRRRDDQRAAEKARQMGALFAEAGLDLTAASALAELVDEIGIDAVLAQGRNRRQAGAA